ncbi:hypothetical protein FRX31_007457, partial [Thalictrum thalictroides]
VVPKRILAFMKVEGLSKGHIASHLQKYRLHQNKYKGTPESGYPRRKIRMRLLDEAEYHNDSPSHNHSMWSDDFNYHNRPQSPLLANQPGQQDNIHSPNNFDQVHSSALPQYHFQEGSKDSFMAQANYGNSAAVTNPENLERPLMSSAPTINQTILGEYSSLFGTAPLNSNDLNIGSIANATPITVEQQITDQGIPEFLSTPLVPNFDNLSFESLPNSPPSVEIMNMGPLGAWNGILSGTIGGGILNNENFADISRMDEIRKGKKHVEEVEDEYSLLDNPLYFNGINSYMTSQGESFVLNPNHAAVGESSIKAMVNLNKLQQGNEVNNSSWFTSVDDIADFLLNQGSEIATEACVILKPQFDFYKIYFLRPIKYI